jgi:hypothetical protein
MSRWIRTLLVGGLGIALGLLYGWVIAPVTFVDTTPASLRSDYRTDYVLMVAEAFHTDQDPQAAQRQLAILGGRSPADVSAEALQTARASGYSPADVSIMQELTRAMQSFDAATSLPGGLP